MGIEQSKDEIVQIGRIFLSDENKNIVIVTHDRADGDGLGSMLAMGNALSAHDKNVTCVIFDELAPRYAFLSDDKLLRVLGKDISVDELFAADTFVILDTAVEEQLEPINEFLMRFKGKIIIIDHHSHYELQLAPEIVWQDKSVAATGILISQLLDGLDWLKGAKIAEYLLIAIGSDTGWFRYNNTDAECFKLAERFVRLGANSHCLYEKLFLSDSPERFKLLARALNSSEFYANNRLITLTLRRLDFQQTGASQSDTENIIDEACRVNSLEIAALFVEQEDLKTRISLRSRSAFDVNRFAKQFGGGGHPKAAGIKLKCSLSEAKEKIITALTTILSEHKQGGI